MQRCQAPPLPGRCPPLPGGRDPPPLDRRDDAGRGGGGVAAATAAAAAGSPVIATTLMPAIDVGALFIGWEEWEGNNGSGVATGDDDHADAEAGEYARKFLEDALSQLWEGLSGRRMITAKTMEASRDDKQEEVIVPQSMFEMLCEGVRREMHRCNSHRRPPPEDEARPSWPSLSSSSSNGTSPQDVARTTAMTD